MVARIRKPTRVRRRRRRRAATTRAAKSRRINAPGPISISPLKHFGEGESRRKRERRGI
jgi:hypothetical protein